MINSYFCFVALLRTYNLGFDIVTKKVNGVHQLVNIQEINHDPGPLPTHITAPKSLSEMMGQLKRDNLLPNVDTDLKKFPKKFAEFFKNLHHEQFKKGEHTQMQVIFFKKKYS